MKTYYEVTTTFDDNGKVTSEITDTIEAEEKPVDTYESKDTMDVYKDWFDNKKAADNWIEQSKYA